jgi:hypothetical protein
VNLARNMLSGTIPLEIGLLSLTMDINFAYNSLTGSVPMEVCELGDKVDYSDNQFLTECVGFDPTNPPSTQSSTVS